MHKHVLEALPYAALSMGAGTTLAQESAHLDGAQRCRRKLAKGATADASLFRPVPLSHSGT